MAHFPSAFDAGYAFGSLFIWVLIFGTPRIFFLLLVQRSLNAVHPHCRKMPPNQVWLSMIPLFNFVWDFIIVSKLSDSLAAEFTRRGIPTDRSRVSHALGIAACVLFPVCIIPGLGPLAMLAYLVVGILYWVKIENYKSQLMNDGLWNNFSNERLYQQYMQNPYVQQQYQQNYGGGYQGNYNPNQQGNQNWQPPQNPYTGQYSQHPPPANNPNQQGNQNWQPPQNPNIGQNLPNVPPANDNSQWQPPQPPPAS